MSHHLVPLVAATLLLSCGRKGLGPGTVPRDRYD